MNSVTKTSKQWQRDEVAERKINDVIVELKNLKRHLHNMLINLNRCRAKVRTDRQGAKDARLCAHGCAVEADSSLMAIKIDLVGLRDLLGYKEEGGRS